MSRRILIVAHPKRPEALKVAAEVEQRLTEAGIEVAVQADEAPTLDLGTGEAKALEAHKEAAEGAELVLVLGGDGTILRGAEFARAADVPLLGINLGHVGFLAEAERADVAQTVDRIVARDYTIEERMTLHVDARAADGQVTASSWALNDVSVEKAARERMLEITLEVDGRPLSSWGCDGIVVSTPTGSTAYAFSAGGPIVWPHVDAMLVVPNSAHALFARPLVLRPDTNLAIEVTAANEGRGVMWCDGRRYAELAPGARIEIRRGLRPVRLARLTDDPFTDRLVAKFDLSVAGWRGGPRKQTPSAEGGQV